MGFSLSMWAICFFVAAMTFFHVLSSKLDTLTLIQICFVTVVIFKLLHVSVCACMCVYVFLHKISCVLLSVVVLY